MNMFCVARACAELMRAAASLFASHRDEHDGDGRQRVVLEVLALHGSILREGTTSVDDVYGELDDVCHGSTGAGESPLQIGECRDALLVGGREKDARFVGAELRRDEERRRRDLDGALPSHERHAVATLQARDVAVETLDLWLDGSLGRGVDSRGFGQRGLGHSSSTTSRKEDQGEGGTDENCDEFVHVDVDRGPDHPVDCLVGVE